MAAAKSVFFSLFLSFPLTRPKDERTVIGRTVIGRTPLSSWSKVLCLPKDGSARVNLVLAASDEGQARVVCVSALAGGDLAVERSEVHRVLRLGEQTPDDACFEGGRACEFVDEHT